MEHVHLGDFGRQAVSYLLGQSRHNYFTKKNSTHPLTFISLNLWKIEMSRPVAGGRVVPALHCYSGSHQFKEETSPEV